MPESVRHAFTPRLPTDLETTLRFLRRGPFDPTFRVRGGEVWRATRTPEGAGTERLRQVGGTIEIEAWGPGAAWLVDHAPVLCGGLDDERGFDPAHPLLREVWRRHRGFRLARTEAVFEAALATILEQKVPGMEAWRSWRALVRALGEPAPGPLPGLFGPPAPEVLAGTPYFTFHGFGVERRRADTARHMASRGKRLEDVAAMPPGAARSRLTALPGVGSWSAAEIALTALGDPDSVSVGDYHLPHMVAYALAGEPRGTDERMLELLEPYRGHRGRVLRLLELAGISAPRYGPRVRLRQVASM